MGKLTTAQVTAVKGRGFLRNRGTDNFSGRVLPKGSVFTVEELKAIVEIAEKFGNGIVAPTTRLTMEIVGIPFEKIEEAEKLAAERGLVFGGTGAKIRPITACKGTTCVYGNFDTQKMAEDFFRDYYEAWGTVKLPHKFKIGIGGCPNSCMKPSLNDFGIEGHRTPVYDPEQCKSCANCQVFTSCPMQAVSMVDGKAVIDDAKCTSCGVCLGKCPFGALQNDAEPWFQVTVGGTWGKKTRIGTTLKGRYSEKELKSALEKTMLWYKKNAYQGERLGKAIDRVGLEQFEREIASGELLEHKEEILQAEMRKA